MTGNKARRLPPYWGLGGLLLASPAVAQAPVPAPASSTLGPPPSVTLDFGSLSGGARHATGEDVHFDYGGELTVDAAHFEGAPALSQFDVTGQVRAHAHDTTLHADRLDVDGLRRLGFSEGVVLTRRPFTVRAGRMDFQPNGLTATRADITTVPPDEKPDIELRAGSLAVTTVQKAGQTRPGAEHIVLRDVSLYLLHNRILTLRHLATTYHNPAPGQARRQPPRPTAGYSGRYGPFVGYSSTAGLAGAPLRYGLLLPLHGAPQVRLTSFQPLLVGPALRPEVPPPPAPAAPPNALLTTLRALTTAPPRLLPEGDPLLFHDFLPDANPIRPFDSAPRANITASEELSSHVETTGNGRTDLFVSRYPEVAANGTLPLTRAYALPAPGDPASFRHYLRHLVLYLGATVGAGRYYEQPTDITANRVQYSVGLSLRPLLVAPNTLLLPGYSVTSYRYSDIGPFHHAAGGFAYLGSDSGRPFGGDSYSYTQYSLALNHYFSPFSAVGAQYTVSQPHGESPFNFDVLDTTRELDGRVQVGNRRLAVAGYVRYDALHPRVIDYTLAVAPALHGFTPVFSYRFFSRAIGLNIEIPGLTF